MLHILGQWHLHGGRSATAQAGPFLGLPVPALPTLGSPQELVHSPAPLTPSQGGVRFPLPPSVPNGARCLLAPALSAAPLPAPPSAPGLGTRGERRNGG